MFGLSPRDLKKFLKGLEVEEVKGVVRVQLQLTDGSTLVIDSPSQVAKVRMPQQKITMLQVMFDESKMRREVPKALPEKEEGGPSEEDIRLIMEQTGCTYDEALQALREASGDLVQAAMIVLRRKGST